MGWDVYEIVSDEMAKSRDWTEHAWNLSLKKMFEMIRWQLVVTFDEGRKLEGSILQNKDSDQEKLSSWKTVS